MDKIIENQKPLVSILLAVYKPNEKWLIEQLKSLNHQTYENLELIVWDDCPQFPIKENLLKENITNFPYTLHRGEINMGSNKAFESLTRLANGNYIAYCDQDDIWLSKKISVSIEKIISTNAVLVYSDMFVIDENNNKIGNSICDIYKRINFKWGTEITNDLILKNCITGCAMVIDRSIAQEAIPFETLLIHDWWLGIFASTKGRIEFIKTPLIKYRKHSTNQTGPMEGVKDKKSYYELKILNYKKRIDSLAIRIKQPEESKKLLALLQILCRSRCNYFNKPNLHDLKIILKYGKHMQLNVILELILMTMPNFIFKKIIQLYKKGIL